MSPDFLPYLWLLVHPVGRAMWPLVKWLTGRARQRSLANSACPSCMPWERTQVGTVSRTWAVCPGSFGSGPTTSFGARKERKNLLQPGEDLSEGQNFSQVWRHRQQWLQRLSSEQIASSASYKMAASPGNTQGPLKPDNLALPHLLTPVLQGPTQTGPQGCDSCL